MEGGTEQAKNYSDANSVLTNSVLTNSLSFRDALSILFVLLAMFFLANAWKPGAAIDKARIEAMQELQKIGLEKEDIGNNKAMSLIKLQQHPIPARRIQEIGEKALLSDMQAA